jgi:hypothetical protein
MSHLDDLALLPQHGWVPDSIEDDYSQDVADPKTTDGPVPPTSDSSDPAANSEALENGMSPTQMEPLRTLSGLLDLMHDLAEGVTSFVNGDMPRAKAERIKPIDVQALGGALIDTRSWQLDQSRKIADKRNDRTRLVVTNQSASIVYLSSQSGAKAADPQTPNQIVLQPLGTAGNSREFFTRGELWAVPSTAGPLLIDVVDEYGCEY